MRPGAPMVCVAWRGPGENDWVARPLELCADLLADLPAPPRAERGAPGPFGWADPTLPVRWLTEAGWRSVAWRDVDAPLALAAPDSDDPAADAALARKPHPVGEGARAVVMPAGHHQRVDRAHVAARDQVVLRPQPRHLCPVARPARPGSGSLRRALRSEQSLSSEA